MNTGDIQIYPSSFEQKIGFDRIREIVEGYTVGSIGEAKIREKEFSSNSTWIETELLRVTEFQDILSGDTSFPETVYFDLSESLSRLKIEGTFPELQELFDLKRSIECGRSISSFFKKSREDKYLNLKSLTGKLILFPMVLDRIEQIVDKTGQVKDNASKELASIRSSISSKKNLVSKKLSSILRQAQSDGIADADTTVSVRSGRGVIPVNASDKRRLRGMVHDQSATGKTVYIEPEEIVELNNEISDLEYEERREIVRILMAFADFIRPYIDDMLPMFDFLGEIDSIRARAIYGNNLDCIMPEVKSERMISWKNARHPLLELALRRGGRSIVPLDIELDENERILVISGPNAGGKSVCLKSVGLLQYMFQCGFPVSVAPGSAFGVFEKILLDIGDEQSIENDLSTYSSHLINMKNFLRMANNRSLVLVDEFGAGTEPMIGGAIAEAVLSGLNQQGVFGLFTTHYTNLKHFAANTEGIVNGAMSYDNQLMQPLFVMVKGKPGSSFAFEIARKIGLPENLLELASERAGKDNVNFDKHLREIARDKKYWERKRQNIRKSEKRIEELLDRYESEVDDLKQKKKEIIGKAKEDASLMMAESNKLIEGTIRSIKEAQADREKTKEARLKLEAFKELLAVEKSDREAGPSPELDLHLKKRRDNSEQERKRSQPKKEKAENNTIAVGSFVKVTETNSYGEVTDIKGAIATLSSGSLALQINIDRLEPVTKKEYSGNQKVRKNNLNWEMTEKRNSFKPEIDIRGIRSEEAMEMVQELVDGAIMVGYRNIRILHGKGTGILRENVRQYLAVHPVVSDFRDEHVDFGGSGITTVVLDV